MFNKTAVLGIGLIGASFARAIRQKRLCAEILGYGRSRDNLERAKERGIIDSFTSDPAEACRDADLIMLATPVGAFSDLVKKISPFLKKGAVVTDAGSVKGKLVYEIEGLMPEGIYYIGGHPIAGSDRSGIDFSSPELFTNARCIITPTENSDAGALRKITDMWKALGAEVAAMTPERHDTIYASVSHLPHIIAYAMVNTAAEIDQSSLEFCGQGFKDTTRIASSPPEIWRDICMLNRDNLVSVMAVFQKNLDMLGQYLRASDAASLEREFSKARTLREGIGQN